MKVMMVVLVTGLLSACVSGGEVAKAPRLQATLPVEGMMVWD